MRRMLPSVVIIGMSHGVISWTMEIRNQKCKSFTKTEPGEPGRCLGHVETTYTADMRATVSIVGCGNQKHSGECKAWSTCRARDYLGGWSEWARLGKSRKAAAFHASMQAGWPWTDPQAAIHLGAAWNLTDSFLQCSQLFGTRRTFSRQSSRIYLAGQITSNFFPSCLSDIASSVCSSFEAKLDYRKPLQCKNGWTPKAWGRNVHCGKLWW